MVSARTPARARAALRVSPDGPAPTTSTSTSRSCSVFMVVLLRKIGSLPESGPGPATHIRAGRGVNARTDVGGRWAQTRWSLPMWGPGGAGDRRRTQTKEFEMTTMTHTARRAALSDLTADLDRAVRGHASDVASAEAVSRALAPYLGAEGLLTDEQRLGDPDRYRQHVLHVADDGAFSVVALVWLP